MSEVLSPFVFKKVSFEHLELDTEIVLKFRKATLVDTNRLAEQYGVQYLYKKLQDAFAAAETLFQFLSPDSRKELQKIPMTEFDDTKEDFIGKELSVREKFLMCFQSTDEAREEIYELFLSVFGYSQKQIDMFKGIIKEEVEKEKKTQKNGQKKKP